MPPTLAALAQQLNGTVDASSYTITGLTPGASGRVLILVIHAARNTNNPPLPTVSGGTVTTWNHHLTLDYDTGGTGRASQFVFWGISGSGSADVTIDFGGATLTTCQARVIEVTDGNTTTPITTPDATASGGPGTSTGDVSLTDIAADARPMIFVAISRDNDVTPRTNWVELGADIQSGGENNTLHTAWRNAAETTGSATWTQNAVFGAIVMEIAPAAGGTPDGRLDASFAELEVPDQPSGRLHVSFAEVETPLAPARMDVSFAELEVPDQPNGRLHVSWAELEAPLAPARMDVSWSELEVPSAADGRLNVSFTEFEVPDQPSGRLDIAFIELETPNAPARLDISHAYFQVPTDAADIPLIVGHLVSKRAMSYTRRRRGGSA